MIARRATPIAVHRHESPLGSWLTAMWSPGPGDELERAVDAIWYFDGSLASARERVFPSGTLELVLQFDEPHRPVLDDGRAGPAYQAACITGMQLGAYVIEGPAHRTRVMGVRVKSAAATELLGIAPRELLAGTYDLRDVCGRAADDFASACEAARGSTARVEAAIAWLRERSARARADDRAADPFVLAVAGALERSHGNASIAALAARTALSPAAFARRFGATLGVSPKRFARLVRFRHALDLLAAGASLRDVALGAGYYDQPHFNADFRDHAGMTPRAYLAANRADLSANLLESAEG